MHRALQCGLLVCTIVLPARAATFSDSAAASHVGETGTVCGTVASVYRTRSDTTFLDFGAAYPSETFTAVIFGTAMSGFTGLAELRGHKVCITGSIGNYRGRPEMILHQPTQLKHQD